MPLLLNASAEKSNETAEPLLLALCGSRDHSWQLCTEGEYSCGSSLSDDIRIELSGIEAGHCRLVYRAGQLFVRRGRGRIWVHELPVASDARLCEGDILSLGGVALRFEGVVTAWIRAGRRQSTASEFVEASTPKVQFVGHSNLPFGRLSSVMAPVRPVTESPAAEKMLDQAREVQAVAESRLAKREQAVSEAEAVIARMLDEIEKTRNTEQELRRQADLQRRELAELRQRLESDAAVFQVRKQELRERETALDARQHELTVRYQAASVRDAETATHECLLHAREASLGDRERVLQQATVELQSRQQQLETREAALASREQLHLAREQSSRLRIQELDAQEHSLQAARQLQLRQTAEVQSRLAELAKQGEALAGQTQELTLLQQEQAELRQRLREQQEELSGKQRSLEIQEQDLAGREEQLRVLGGEVSRRDELLLRQSVELSDREQRLHDREQHLSAKEQQFTAREKQFTSRELELFAREEQATAREQQLAAYDLQLVSRARGLQENEQADRAIQEASAKRLIEIASVDARLAAEREQLAEKLRIAESRERDLSERMQQCDDRHLDLAAREQQLRKAVMQLQEHSRQLETQREELESRMQQFAIGERTRGNQSEELSQLRTRLQEAESGLREREKLIREMYVRLAEQGHAKNFGDEVAAVSMGDVFAVAADTGAEDALRTTQRTEAAAVGETNPILPAMPTPERTVEQRDADEPFGGSSEAVVTDTKADATDGDAPESQSPRIDFQVVPPLPSGILSSDLLDLLHPVSDRPWTPQSEITERTEMPNVVSPADSHPFTLDRSSDPEMRVGDSLEAEFVGGVAVLERPLQEQATGEPSREEGPDDAVRAYMSQLLVNQSERRSSPGQPGGATVRSHERLYADQIVRELRKKTEKKKPGASRTSVSYIERFMSGDRKPWEDDSVEPVATESVDAEVVQSEGAAACREPRQKIDIRKLRVDMQGFRAVSSLAANQAVVSHSLKKSRSGLMPRAGVVSVFLISTVLLARGPMQLGQTYPGVLLGNVIMLLASSIELARKIMQVIWMHLTAPKAALDDVSGAGESGEESQPSEESAEEFEQPIF